VKTAHIEDGVIKGTLTNSQPRGRDCQHCGELNFFLVYIKELSLPEPLTPVNSLILYHFVDSKLVPIKYVGIGCGCYARAHRQIAKIQLTMERKRESSASA
jgi:hypothetical protein